MKKKNNVEIQYPAMPVDFWNHMYNPITGFPYSKRQLTYIEKSSKKYYKTHDILEK